MGTKLYTNLPENRPSYMREKLAARLDDYCRFHWNNEDAWEKYHAFIVTSKRGDLKFHTGPSFSNSYSTPQFGQDNNLLGVKYSTASVSFNVGFYYITEKDWRSILEAFHPLEIGWLQFDFEPNWRYQCKLNKIGDTSRYILETYNKEDYYYAETTLTFDLVGEPFAYTQPYEFEQDGTEFKVKETDYVKSDLDFPLDISINLNLSKILESNTSEDKNNNFTLAANFKYEGGTSIQLFKVEFQNISYSDINSKTEQHWPAFITVKYRSKTGLLLQQEGEEESLLSLQQSTASGERLVASMTSIPYLWTGEYNKVNAEDFEKVKISFSIKVNNSEKILDGSNIAYYDSEQNYAGYGPTEYAKVFISGCGRTRVI